MHSYARTPALFLGMAGALALAVSAPVAAQDSVRVAIPLGLHADVPGTSESRTAGMKFVTIGSIRIFNPSRSAPQSFMPSQFHLLVGDAVYYPVVRPGLEALDLSETSVLAPASGTQVTVTFLVPDAVASAKFEFVPHWLADDGHTVDFCCLYL